MGKKSVKSRKEKMPANSEEYFWRTSQLIDCSAGCAFWWQCPSNAGDYKEHYRIKKGGSDPLSLFGPQAGRKEGVAPALLTYSPAYDLCDLGLILHCLVEGYDVTAWKTERKTVRKTDFRTVFYYSNCCEAHIGAHLAQDSLEKQHAIPETVERNP